MQSNQGIDGGMGGNSMQEMQRLQQQFQAQYQHQQQQRNADQNPSLGVTSQSFGSQSQFNPAAAMMHHQSGGSLGGSSQSLQMMQRQQMQQNIGGTPGQTSNSNVASIYGNMGGLSNQAMLASSGNPGIPSGQSSSMDASSGSSARLLAMAGMNMNTAGAGGRPNSSSTMQNMQMFLQQQNKPQMGNMMMPFGGNFPGSQFQAGQPGVMNPGIRSQQMMGGSPDIGSNAQQMMMQQHLLNLQKQMQGQGGALAGIHQSHQQMQTMGVPTDTSTLSLQSRQQQLLQQIQQQQQQQQGSSTGSTTNHLLQQRIGMMQHFARQQQQGQPQSQNYSGPHSNFGAPAVQNIMSSQQSLSGQNSVGGGSVSSRQQSQHEIGQSSLLRQNQSQSSASQGGHSHQGSRQPQMMGQEMHNSFQQFAQTNASRNAFHGSAVEQSMDDLSGSRSLTQQHLQRTSQPPSNAGDPSMHSQHSVGSSGAGEGSVSLSGLHDATSNLQSQKSFLDGNFEGGWQSNADIPDRRRVIFSILDVIRQSHGLGDEVSNNRLPHMAKTLEEHLYRSARTKAEYLDPVTLRRRLRRIAQGLDIHRTGSQDDLEGQVNSQSNATQKIPDGLAGNVASMVPGQNAGWNTVPGGMNQQAFMQQQMIQGAIQGTQLPAQIRHHSVAMPLSQGQMQVVNWSQMSGGLQDNGLDSHSNIGMDESEGHDTGSVNYGSTYWPGDAGSVSGSPKNPVNPEYPNTAKFQDPDASQKKKVILQQQQRLLLLRHASKCKQGAACTVKFCPQMVVLWKHMKTCRDRNCETSHCLSSRCVLNHYRICKSQGRTATCEVCGPVMSKIKVQGRDDGSGDPLARDDPLTSSQQSLPSIPDRSPGLQVATSTSPSMAHQRAESGNLPIQKQPTPGGMTLGISTIQQADAGSVPSTSSQRNQIGGISGNSLGVQRGTSIGTSIDSNAININSIPGNVSSAFTSFGAAGTVNEGGLPVGGMSALNTDGIPISVLPSRNMNAKGNALGMSLTDTSNMSGDEISGDMAMAGGFVANSGADNTIPGDQSMTDVTGGDSQLKSDHIQLNQLKQHQLKMQAQLESLKELQRQQQQLLDQQTRLREQSMLISDPNSPQAQQLQQQQLLLDELQKRCQQQQSRLQKEIEVQSDAVNMVDGSVSAATAEQQQLSQQMSQHLQEFASQVAAAASAFDHAGPHFPQAMSHTSPENMSEGMIGAFGDLPIDKPVPTIAPSPKKKGEVNLNMAKNRGGKGKRVKGKALRQHIEELQAETAGANDMSGQKRKMQIGSSDLETSEKLAKSAHISETLKPLPENSASLVSILTAESIVKHLESLNKNVRLSSRTVTHKCLPIIQELIDDQFGWVFHDAVDPVALGLPDYFEVVKKPMHLELVKKKLENAIYPEMEMFARDVRLVFENAVLYNGESSEVGELAQAMLLKFNKLYSALVQGVESSQLQLESRGEACSLCAQQKRRFEPAVLYCQGQFGTQRIKRGATYYSDETRAWHWSEAEYASLPEDVPIVLDNNKKVLKADLQKHKNDDLPEEAWIRCDVCGVRVHQICALYHSGAKGSTASFVCPNCVLTSRRNMNEQPSMANHFKGAVDLPQCDLSRRIESGLAKTLALAYEALPNDSGSDLACIEKVEGLSIRVLSDVDKKFSVGQAMTNRYAYKNYPKHFAARSKCIALFQKIHGVDTFLFAFYAYEYNHECPAPNKNCIYIPYMDSVKYFEPKAYRTLVYQQVLIEYLTYARDHGFHTAHFWSCPPTPGDDCFFHCHPQHQLIPREDMLRSWFHTMIDKAKLSGVVERTTNFYDEYFHSDDTSPLSVLSIPYFEGDYVPGELESIIDQVSENQQVETYPDRDIVLERLGRRMSRMKDNFIVVHLFSKSGDDEAEKIKNLGEAGVTDLANTRGESKDGRITVDSDDISQDREMTSEQLGCAVKAARVAGMSESKESGVPPEPSAESTGAKGRENGMPSASEKSDPVAISRSTDNELGNIEATKNNVTMLNDTVGGKTEISNQKNTVGLGERDDADTTPSQFVDPSVPIDAVGERDTVSAETKEAKDDAPCKAQAENDDDASVKAVEKDATSSTPKAQSIIGDDLIDASSKDVRIESRLFESRQFFLTFCQTSHCQFDELRRAKHSTMVVLYHLHNPSDTSHGIDPREVRRHQQLMDDRRRQAQNELIHPSTEP